MRAKPSFFARGQVTVCLLLLGIEPARNTINRALMLFEKSLTVNSVACLGYEY